jgi:hypothetical protein
MGRSTKNGRTRNRRVQQLASVIQGQPPVLALALLEIVSTTVHKLTAFGSELTEAENLAIAPGATLRVIVSTVLANTPENATVTAVGGVLTITTATPLNSGDSLVVLPWNEGVRGQNGEWLAMTIAQVP